MTGGNVNQVAEIETVELYYDDVVTESASLADEVERVVRAHCQDEFPETSETGSVSIEYITVIPGTGTVTVEYTVLG